MTETQYLAIVHIGTGLFLIGLSIPLTLRKVGMNQLYGVRFSVSYKSEQNWYDINETGGKIIAGWSGLLILYGIAGFFLPASSALGYGYGGAAVTLIMAVGMTAHAYFAAKKIDKRNSWS